MITDCMPIGSLIILHSLKRAGPSLVRVAFFLLFALVLFSVIGIQSFAGSYRRSCVWLDPDGISNFSTGQVCGSWFDGSGDRQVFLESDLTSAKGVDFKGFTCPQGQICIVRPFSLMSIALLVAQTLLYRRKTIPRWASASTTSSPQRSRSW